MEKNTDRFEVEYATDGRHFQKLGTVRTAYSLTGETAYSMKHDHAAALGLKELHYRIKQLDRDGHYTFSEVCTVSLVTDKQVTLYPNPVTTDGSLTVSADEIHDIQIYNSTGNLIWSRQYKGVKEAQIAIGHWASGVYHARVNGSYFIKFSIR